MRNAVEALGLPWPGYADWVSAAAAIVVVVFAWGVSHLLSRRFSPALAAMWERRAGARAEGLGERMCALSRHLFALVLLGIALNLDTWRPLGSLIIGLSLAAAAALFIKGVVRGLHMPRWAALLLGGAAFLAILARSVGGLEPITDLLNRVGFDVGTHRFSLLAVIQIAVTLVALYAVVILINRIVGQTIRHASGLDATQQLLAQKLAGVVILVAAFFIGIDLVGIDLTALAVFSGAFGLAVGFGLQKTFGNLIAGIILLMDRSVKPGDVIVVGDTFGHVTKIGVRAVSIVTRDGKEHLIPNENLMTQEVENWSYSSRDVRVHIPVGVSYNADLALAQRLMIEAAGASKRVLKAPSPRVWLRAFGDSSVDHEILVWIADPESGVGNVQSEILNRLWVLFKENGVEIPFPQRDLHVKEWPAAPPRAEA
ncbi:MAG TPA: mechanosensitive ion channel domain-containing protein [Allosphingosinicella sp.]|nr:mechanosensitive ion channel domain-containing protein [Allosphingosinicella sp.]